MGYNSGACDALSEPDLDATLTVQAEGWGLTYHIEAGFLYLEGELIKDTLVELRYCNLEIASQGEYEIIDTSADCRPSPFSSCTGVTW
jgi:hypothetical protein